MGAQKQQQMQMSNSKSNLNGSYHQLESGGLPNAGRTMTADNTYIAGRQKQGRNGGIPELPQASGSGIQAPYVGVQASHLGVYPHDSKSK